MDDFEIAKRMRDCLVQLIEGKASEKKKQVDNLKSYLKQNYYVQHMNRSSAKGKVREHGGVYITWGKCFSRIKDYIEQECERLKNRESSDSLSAVVKNNIIKEKKSCSDLFRCFVKAMKSNKQYDMAEPVMQHILAVLSRKFTQVSFGLDYSNILLKYILCDPFMCLKISSSTFDDAIWFYCKIIGNPPQGWERSLTTQILLQLLTIRFNFGVMDCTKILQFFTEIFDAVKQDRASWHHEYLLQCLLLVCKNLQVDYRCRLCQLGESILLPIMQLWKTRPAEKCQTLMLEFARFQLALHHPNGAVKENDGAYAYNWSVWKSHLINFYKMIMRDLNALCEKNKYSSSKESMLKPIFISVAVEVFAQVFIDPIDALDVTQSSTFDSSMPLKKRRIEVSFSALIDALSSAKILPWLQVISDFITKHPDIVSSEDAHTLLDALVDIHVSCTDIETKIWLLHTFQSLVQAFGKEEIGNIESEFHWQRVWEIAVKSVSLMHQCQDAGHKLLKTLLFHKLVIPKTEFYALYNAGSSNKMTASSLETLAVFLESYPQSQPLAISQTSSHSTASGSGVFIHQVLEWLFSRKGDDNSPFQVLSDEADLYMLENFAKVSAVLCLQNNKLERNFSNINTNSDPRDWICVMEKDLLRLTFNLPLYNEHNKKLSDFSFNLESLTVFQPVWDTILQFFSSSTSGIFEALINNIQISTPCTLIKHACLLFEMLQTFYFEGIIKQCDLKSNFFTSHLMKTLNAVGEMQSKLKFDLCEKETILMLKDFICRITTLFKLKCLLYNTQSLEPFLEVVISCIPQNLFESILVFSLDNCSVEPSAVDLNTTFENFDMEDDISFDVENLSGSNSRDGLDEMTDECDNFETKLEDKDSLSFMDVKTLPEKLQLQLQCLDFLAEISQILNSNNSSFRSFQEQMVNKLLSRLPENDHALQRAADVHLVIKSLKCILLSRKLSYDNLDKVLCSLRLLLNQFSQLQDLCQTVLEVFPLLYMHVRCVDSNHTLQQKERMFHLLSILCKKQLEAEGSNLTSLLIAKMLLEIIQLEPTVSWKKINSDSSWNQNTSPCKKETVLYSLVMFLKTNFASFRVYIAEKINLHSSSAIIDAVFLTVCSEVYDSFLQKSVGNVDFEADENFNRLSIFLHYLCQVILKYPCLEKECVYIMCKVSSNVKKDQSFFTKVLKQISYVLGYESCKKYVEPHLPYIILRWIEEKYCLKEFPFQLLEIDSLKLFYREFFKIFVPFVLYYGENAMLSEVAQALEMSEQEIMYECFPEIQAKILASFSVNSMDSKAENIKRCLESVIPVEVLNKANRNKCDEIVFLLLSMVKETNSSHSPKCQAKELLYLSPGDFSTSVTLLMSLMSDKSSFSHFLCNKADLIQHVFLSLSVMLFKAKRAHEERRVLCMYSCFLDQLLPALSSDIKWSFFVIKELIYTIINFLDLQRKSASQDELLITYSSELILSLCKQVMPHFKEVIGEYLPFMISTLIPFVNDSEKEQRVFSLISFLVIDCAPHLVEYIPYLDPFPDLKIFSSLVAKLHLIKYMNKQLPLEKEIKLFLASGKMMGRHTPEGIRHLCTQLKSTRNIQEMKQIVNQLKSKTLFSEDVKHSILHELVCHLSSLCAPGHSFEVQKEASKCLGMIGPIAFSSVVLQPSFYVKEGSFNSLEKNYLVILDIVADYLFDKSIDIKVTSSNVLKDLFSTVFGHKFFKTYQDLLRKNMTMKYIFPFFASQKGKEKQKLGKSDVEKLLDTYLWLPDKSGHSSWIINLVCTILNSGVTQNCFYECLIPICAKQAIFCEKILPYVIHTLLFLDDLHVLHAVSTGIESFFSHCSKWLQKAASNGSSYSPSFTKPEFEFSKASVQSMLSVLNHIWLNPKQESRNQRNVMKECFWQNLNYLEVAQAAQYCSAHFTAILYTELWCDVMKEQVRSSDVVSNSSESSGSLDCSPLSFIGSCSRDKASLVYEILLDAYSRIGDSDAIYGCEVVSPDSQAILKHNYLTERKWDGLLWLNDKNNSHLDILMSLQQNGLNTILQGYAQSLLDGNKASQQSVLEYQCEAAWRMRKWDLPVIENSDNGFQTYLYKSQQCLISDNKLMFEQYLDLARKSQFNLLSHTSLESTRNIQPFLSNIKLLSVLEEFFAVKSNPEGLQSLFEVWELQDQIPYDDFEFFEPVSWLKCVLLNHLIDVDMNKHIVIPHVRKLLERQAVRAREEFHLEVASNAVHTLRKMPCVEEDLLRWQIEEAKILWTRKEFSIANKILKSSLHFIEKLAAENPSFVLCYGEALTLRGRWLAETCSENSSVIMQDYLEKAVLLLESVDCKKSNKASLLWDAYLAVARYADAQYQSIVNYKKSTAFLTKQELMHSSKEDAKKLKSKDNTEDQRKTHVILTKQTMIDQEEINTLEQDQKLFLNKAIMNYLKCLRGTDSHDLWIFRLISLWFQNLGDQSVNSVVKDSIHNLHTYKFLPLIYQLAARMGTPAQGIFSQTLTSLIKSIAIDHPYHAVPVVLALSNADQDPVESLKKNSDQPQVDVPYIKERMNAAKKILSQLQKSKISGILKNYQDLCSAYIKLAYFPVDKKTRRGSIPEDQPLLKYKNIVNIPIITEDIRVDRSCEYENIISIQSFHSEFRMCGGITLPKVIKCKGSDGIEREQLVKGGDDLRQDAVMQQVFFLVNQLLDQKMETKRRRLHIRTYKVVPISRKSGVIQWCDGTQVMSQYLVGGQNGAHARYYPQMASHIECRKKMETIASVSLLCKKREIFDSICANFPPVFRYFFLEHFPEPSAWFERRQSYTKSVAASSIVGYILGLGDRHVNNILIDKNTAEVVHIDFGIAFEKGRVLATPETVPFRLTRDIVDGMGINGVEGTFKRCSEKTLEVMRNSQDVLLTILEVLLYDPLYEWTVPPSKSPPQRANLSTSFGTQEVNKLAERALMRLQQKLQGFEEGVAMSIEGQVNLLIQQARDPNNLCKLYVGWQPYL